MDVFDYTQAMERVAGDRDLFKELLEIFYDDVPNRLAQLGRAVSDGDAESVRQEAHTLKGALGNLGSIEAFNLAATMEQFGRERRLADAPATLDRIVAALKRLQEETANLSNGSLS